MKPIFGGFNLISLKSSACLNLESLFRAETGVLFKDTAEMGQVFITEQDCIQNLREDFGDRSSFAFMIKQLMIYWFGEIPVTFLKRLHR